MTALLAGIFISDNGQDMMSIPLVLSSLSGGLNYNATNNGSQIEANIASDDNFSLAAVPEPASLLLLGSGALVMSFIKRRGRKSIAA